MYFLNLSLPEFLAIFGVVSSLVTALYLLDRTGRKRVVSTLRFWPAVSNAAVQQTRRRVREPWSLLLQLLSLLLLLLSLAELEWGARGGPGRDRVLLVDTSAWTAEKWGDQRRTLLDEEKRLARQYLASLPSRDRVLLVRVDALSGPTSTFTTDRGKIDRELSNLSSTYGALNLASAFAFARQAQSWSGKSPGEVVYIGPAMTSDEAETLTPPANLRTLVIEPDLHNCGIQQIGVRRSDEESGSWQATVTVHNYGPDTRTVRLRTAFGGVAFAQRTLAIGSGADGNAELSFSAARAGVLTARIQEADALAGDNMASLQVPGTARLRLAVVTARRDLVKPLLESNHQLTASFYEDIASFRSAKIPVDVVLLDRIALPANTSASVGGIPSLWISPPSTVSPFLVHATAANQPIKSWALTTPLSEGLHARETKIGAAQVMETMPGDIPVGSLSEGPVVVARPGQVGKPAIFAIGFDPFEGTFRYDVTTPLMLANALRWLGPESARTSELAAAQVGSVVIPLVDAENSGPAKVTDMSGSMLPYTSYRSDSHRNLQLFVTAPEIVRVAQAQRERIFSLTLPNVATTRWTPKSTLAGVPSRPSLLDRAPVDLWRWLAVLGGLGFLVEWLLYGPLLRKPKLPGTGRNLRGREGEEWGTPPTSVETEPDLVVK